MSLSFFTTWHRYMIFKWVKNKKLQLAEQVTCGLFEVQVRGLVYDNF
jgi:hypothetical protein